MSRNRDKALEDIQMLNDQPNTISRENVALLFTGIPRSRGSILDGRPRS